MTRIAYTLPALALTLLAGACSSFEERYQASLPVEQRLPIEVATEVVLLDVATDGRGALTAGAQQDVSRFIGKYKQDGAGAIEIQVASGSGRGPAEAQIRDLALINGVPKNKIGLATYKPDAGSRAGLRLAFARYTASVPACEKADWSQDLSQSWDNTPYPSFGCSIQQNIAAMAADPRDLVEARTMDAASADRRTAKTEKYEKGESPSGARSEGDSGKIAEVASGTERK